MSEDSLYIHKEHGDWTSVLRACWENFQTAWLLGRVPRNGYSLSLGASSSLRCLHRAFLVSRGGDFLESLALQSGFPEKLSVLSPLCHLRKYFPFLRGKKLDA